MLSKLAVPYLCLQGTSVASERVFSSAGDLITKKRNRLSSDMISTLVFLNHNHGLLDGI